MTDWFKKNPFLGILGVSALLLAAGGSALLLWAQSAMAKEREAFFANTSQLNALQAARPFPNAENLEAAEAELAHAREILAGLATTVAAQSAPLDENLTPQRFQDDLNARVTALAATAAEAGVTLPENFYLGFEQYRAQLPAVSAAPALGQQLASIAEAVSLLITARVSAISALDRAPLPDETGDGTGASSELHLAPFQLSFVTDQSGFRSALTALTTAQPVLLLKLLQVANSQPSSPPKGELPGQDRADDAPAAAPQIPVVFGRESLAVTLGLSSVSTKPAASPSSGGGS